MYSPYVNLPASLDGTLLYTPTSATVFPRDIVAQAKDLLAAEIGVAVSDFENQQSVIQWKFQSHPCPNPPLTKDTFVVMLRDGIDGAEKIGKGSGVVFVRKDIEYHTNPTTTIYACHTPTIADMNRMFYASSWIADLATGNGDFYGILKNYIERTINRLEYWHTLQHSEESNGGTEPTELMDMRNDPEITVIVELASQGEWSPEHILRGLAPYKYHEVSFRSHNFQIHRLGFIAYSERQEMLLLRSIAEHEIIGYDSLDLGRPR